MMNILITICARGGSKGVPGKNIKEIAGKPLIEYTFDTALLFANKYNCDIILSTDSEDIKIVGRKNNIFCEYERPPESATDTAGKMIAIKHAKAFMESKFVKKYDYVLDLDVTSPLRTVDDLDLALKMLDNDSEAINIFSVSRAAKNPYFNMVEKNENGYYSLVKQFSDNPFVLSRQVAPEVFEMNASFYFYKKSFFDENLESALSEKSMVYVMNHTCFDIDEPIDFDFMEFLIGAGKIQL